jgi:hypothetical protein
MNKRYLALDGSEKRPEKFYKINAERTKRGKKV